MYDYGLSKIYELVINTNPALRLPAGEQLACSRTSSSSPTSSAHTDFFKHNAYFAHTNRQMVETVSVNAERIRQLRVRARRAKRSRSCSTRCSRSRSTSTRTRHLRRDERAEPSATKPLRPRRAAYDDLFYLGEREAPGAGAAGREESPPSPRRTCCCSSPSTRRSWRTGSATCSHIVRAGEALLRAADADEDHERGLGGLLARCASCASWT